MIKNKETLPAPTTNDFDMFADLEPLSAVEIKKDQVATHLTALLNYCQKSRTQIADELGWKKSRVSRVLSGKDNLTIKTICEFSTHLGYDFDVVFHGPQEPRPKQPWQYAHMTVAPLISNLKVLTMDQNAKTPQEVIIDFMTGNHKDFYYGVSTQESYQQKLTPPSENHIPSLVFWNFIAQD